MLPLLAVGIGGCVGNGFQNEAPFYARMADSDVEIAVSTMQTALMNGHEGDTFAWSNDATPMRGAFTPLRTFLTSQGYYCRDYREDLWFEEAQQSFTNMACLDDGGRWVWAEDRDAQ